MKLGYLNLKHYEKAIFDVFVLKPPRFGMCLSRACFAHIKTEQFVPVLGFFVIGLVKIEQHGAA